MTKNSYLPEIASFPFTHIESCQLKEHLRKLLKNMENDSDADPGYVCIAIKAASYPGFSEFISRAFVRKIGNILYPCQPSYDRKITLGPIRQVMTEFIHRSGAPTFFLMAHSISGDTNAVVSQDRVLDLLENLEKTVEGDSYFPQWVNRLEEANKDTLYHLMRMESEPIDMDEVDKAVAALTEFSTLAAWRIHWIKSMAAELDNRIEDPDLPVPKTDLSGLTFEERLTIREAVIKFIGLGESTEYLCNNVSGRFTDNYIQWVHERLEVSMTEFVNEHFNGSLAERLLFTALIGQRGLYELYPFLMYPADHLYSTICADIFGGVRGETLGNVCARNIEAVDKILQEHALSDVPFEDLFKQLTDTSYPLAKQFKSIVAAMIDHNWLNATQMYRRIGSQRREWALTIRDESYNIPTTEGEV